ncbi:MAG: ABC transporter ATP-binding protein/permease [Firmicutes bacterium]|nr:ABC transporter ATP-binding protein/permease [Bacillota bacterium]
MITVENLNKTYDKRSSHANHVLKDISLTLPDTGFVCILGQSGCGKTTLLNTLGGLDSFDSGTITVGDVSVNRYGTQAMELERNHQFGYIFQNYYLMQDRSVAYNVYLGLHSMALSHHAKMKRVKRALSAVEMDRYARRNVAELSGGQKQRVAIARALARSPQVIFADEPTGNLDEANTMNICTLLRQISKSCLVVMVTHEERIARFFADRIITMENGVLKSDTTQWDREALASENSQVLYAGDYSQQHLDGEGIDLRILQEDGAEPVQVTIVALKDRIVIKLQDSRKVSCGAVEEGPILEEGKRPVHTIEEIDQMTELEQFGEDAGVSKGLSLKTLFREAKWLLKEKGKKKAGLWSCLIVLSMLAVYVIGDFLTVAAIRPEDFIYSHSKMLEVKLERGSPSGASVTDGVRAYLEYIDQSGLEMTYVPVVGTTASYTYSGLVQMNTLEEKLYGFSYTPLEKLDAATLIAGRMAHGPEEIVVDRWVLENFIDGNSVLQASIPNVEYFLGKTLSLSKKSITLKIVGICDSGECALYLDPFALISVASGGAQVMSLSQLQELYPGKYDHVQLAANEVLVGPKAGSSRKVGGAYNFGATGTFDIVGKVEENIYASIVTADEAYETMLEGVLISTRNFYVYAEDKETVKSMLKAVPEELNDVVKVAVIDRYGDSYNSYVAATQKKLDGRLIVTVTVLVMSMVLVYLLLRTRLSERRGMIAVYRLLGVQRYKILLLMGIESTMLSLVCALPAVLGAWCVLSILTLLPSIAFSMVLPFGVVIVTWCGIWLFQLLASLVELERLLRLPSAVLAAKYDI